MMANVIGMVFDALVDASIAGAVVALSVWAVVAVIGRLPAAVRCALWWLVALKLLTGLIAMEPVALKVLPPAAPVSTAIYATANPTAVSPALAAPIASTHPWRDRAGRVVVVWASGCCGVGDRPVASSGIPPGAQPPGRRGCASVGSSVVGTRGCVVGFPTSGSRTKRRRRWSPGCCDPRSSCRHDAGPACRRRSRRWRSATS